MLRKPRLYTAGPTPLHPQAVRAAIGPIPYHRSEEFSARFARVQEGLRRAFRTEGPVAVLACSGTGGMEAALANLFAPGDRLAVVVGGKFGRRWMEIASAYGMGTAALELAPGQSVAAATVVEHLTASQPVEGILLTASETSTGTAFDVRAIGAAIRADHPEVTIVVDAVSAIGALPVATDEWQLDAVVGGAQKAFMIPPGLAFVACSERGWQRVQEQRSTPRYYLDLRRYAAAAGNQQTPYTPAIGLVLELEAALQAIEEVGGIAALEANAAGLAAATRAAAGVLQLELLSAASPSPAVTALRAPRPGAAPAIVARLRQQFGAQLSGGQGGLKPDIFRIGHLGYVDNLDLLGLLAALETVLIDSRHPVPRGAGVAAAAAKLAELSGPSPPTPGDR
ncbi:MAG: pyridoxal-phosphate-dependent aminotransferase family protein [Acidobacteriota bacterium]